MNAALKGESAIVAILLAAKAAVHTKAKVASALLFVYMCWAFELVVCCVCVVVSLCVREAGLSEALFLARALPVCNFQF